MTANVKIPVASAENVIAVPLAAVFTEKNSRTARCERFVYVQQGETFEKRNVKVGVSDFNAEIQEGLNEGKCLAGVAEGGAREEDAARATQAKSGGESAGARRESRRAAEREPHQRGPCFRRDRAAGRAEGTKGLPAEPGSPR